MKDFRIKQNRLREIIDGMVGKRIAVIGDVMIDEYLWGTVKRISPEAPVPVLEVSNTSTRLGGAANVVSNLASLNVEPLVVSVCGNDENKLKLFGMLSKSGAYTDTIYTSLERPTTIKTRLIATHQQIVRADREVLKPLTVKEEDAVIAIFNNIVDTIDGVIISDYGKGVITKKFLDVIITKCSEKNIFVSVDPKENHFGIYNGVSIITPNLKEACNALKIPVPTDINDSEILEIGNSMMERFNLKYLLLTLSEKGMALFSRESEGFRHMHTVAHKVFDVTGAGDTVISAFTASIVAGATPLESTFISNHAAGLTVAQLGTASVSPEELYTAIMNSTV